MSDNDRLTDKGILRLFEDGKRFTEELMRENERLRLLVSKLRSDKRDLEGKYVTVSVPELQERVRLLEADLARVRMENGDLRSQFAAVEEENREFAERYVEVERQNSDLISMYVASYRLHSTLVFEEVVKIVKEIVINMIGAERFGVYIADHPGGRIHLADFEGGGRQKGEPLDVSAGPVAGVVATGDLYVGSADPADGQGPVACIPLKLGEHILGVVVIDELLVQKEELKPLDTELFDLIGKHAAAALYASSTYTMSERKRSTLESFVDLLRSDLHDQARRT